MRSIGFQEGCQDNLIGKEWSFQQMVLGQLDIHIEKNGVAPLCLTQYTKINSKWIIDLNIRVKTIKLLRGNIGENLWLWIIPWILRYDNKIKSNKGKNKSEFLKIKYFFASKLPSRKWKGNSEWEKIFENHVCDKGFVVRIYKVLLQLHNKKTILNNPI